jgi:ATP-dependent Clp protease adaptor protein ClpS
MARSRIGPCVHPCGQCADAQAGYGQCGYAGLKEVGLAAIIAWLRTVPPLPRGASIFAELQRLYFLWIKRKGVMSGMIDTVTKPKIKVKTKTERPRLHKVILLNDDYTPREFVVAVLKAEFRMTEDEAHKVMITAHRRGVCVVAVFTKDVAETKATRATDAGRAKGYPLLFTTEPEE